MGGVRVAVMGICIMNQYGGIDACSRRADRASGSYRVTSTETEVAVLFADVVGSTRLYEILGDNNAREMIVSCVDLMREATERNRGTVIKTIGDEILAIFPTCDDAVNAAAEMQQDIGAHPELTVQGQHVAIRIGCHFGPVVLENRDIFGSAVHTANRMTSQAKAGQIILSADTVERLSPEWRAVSRQIDVTTVRGLQEEMELFEVLWQHGGRDQHAAVHRDGHPAGAAATACAPALSGARVPARRCEEGTDDGSRRGERHRRQGDADFAPAREDRGSRDKFLLIDQSTNGTFVTSQEGEEAFVRRDSVILQGKG